MRDCVVFAAGEFDIADFNRDEYIDPFFVCADGGTVNAVKCGVNPNLIVGDFDSFSGELPNCEIVKLPINKDETDTFYAVKLLIERGFCRFHILGGTGGRLDHTIANVALLRYLAARQLRGRLVTKNMTATAFPMDEYTLTHEIGTVFSIFALTSEAKVTVTGVEYELERFLLTAEFPLGISNVVKRIPVKLQVISGIVLCIVNR